MQGSHPLARSFTLLCFGAALGLALLEWRDPFDGESPSVEPSAILTPTTTRISITHGRRPSIATAQKESDTEIVVHLDARTIDVYQQGTIVKQYLVAIGQTDWETPEGRFSVAKKSQYPTWQHPITGEIVPPGKENPLGSRWIGFLSTREGHIGFHGTNEERLIGEAISHGCIRMLNEDIEDLYTYVELGTLVTVKR